MPVKSKNSTQADELSNKSASEKNIQDYMDESENWSYRRWAWEFLCRNEKFIKACEEVENNEKKRKELAKNFGLKQFKSYKELYRDGSGTPKFWPGNLATWGGYTPEEGKPKKFYLYPGQIIVRFDLAFAIGNEQSIEKQLRLTEKLLEKRLGPFLKKKGAKQFRHNHHVNKFPGYLWLLDKVSQNTPRPECARMYFSSGVTAGMENVELGEKIKSVLQIARQYAADRYLSLSLLKGRPGKQGKNKKKESR